MGSSMAYPWADEVSHSFTIAEGPTGGSPLFGLRPRGSPRYIVVAPLEPIGTHNDPRIPISWGSCKGIMASEGSAPWALCHQDSHLWAKRCQMGPFTFWNLHLDPILYSRFFQSSNKSNHRVVTSKQATTGRNHRCSFSTSAITAGLRDQFGSAPSPL